MHINFVEQKKFLEFEHKKIFFNKPNQKLTDPKNRFLSNFSFIGTIF
jgi:hypothetical protein